MIEKVIKRGQGATAVEPYDVKLTIIAKKKAVGISLRNTAKEAIGPFKSVELYMDRDLRRVYFVPRADSAGYLVRNKENKTTIYFQCKEDNFTDFVKTLVNDDGYCTGYLKKNSNGFFIEVPK